MKKIVNRNSKKKINLLMMQFLQILNPKVVSSQAVGVNNENKD